MKIKVMKHNIRDGKYKIHRDDLLFCASFTIFRY